MGECNGAGSICCGSEMSATKLYRARTIKHRERRTGTRIAQLDAQILAELEADHPQSVRHCFYRMTDPRLPEPVEKSDRGYRHVQNHITVLRRAGQLPYNWISDASRRGYFVNTYNGKADFLRSVAGFYRADLWQGSGNYCEVWAESRSIAGVIQSDCEELAVSLFPAGGFSSITFVHEAAQQVNNDLDGRDYTVFYIGDYDPAGVLIDQSIEKELRAHLDSEIDLRFERIGITDDQIDRYDLPRKPRKTSDRRALYVKDSVEAEAMPAHILRSILRAHIEALLPSGALEISKIAEESERDGLLRWARMMDRSPRAIQ